MTEPTYTEAEVRAAVAAFWPRTSPAAGWMPDRIIESLRYSRERAAGGSVTPAEPAIDWNERAERVLKSHGQPSAGRATQGAAPTPQVWFHEFNDDIKWMDHPHPPRKGGWCQEDISYDNRVICCGEQRDHPVHQRAEAPQQDTAAVTHLVSRQGGPVPTICGATDGTTAETLQDVTCRTCWGLVSHVQRRDEPAGTPECRPECEPDAHTYNCPNFGTSRNWTHEPTTGELGIADPPQLGPDDYPEDG